MKLKASISDVFFASTPILLVLLLFYPVILWTAGICWESEDYSHGLILPFAAAYIIWSNLPDLYKKFETSYFPTFLEKFFSGFFGKSLALIFFVVGIFVYYLSLAVDSFFIQWVVLFSTLASLFVLIFNPYVATFLIPPVLLIFMAKPIPDALVPKLFNPFQVVLAKISAKLLEILQVPVFVNGNIVEIPSMQLLVEEACSGMRSIIALLTVALIVLCLVKMKFFAKVFIVLLSVAVAILLNIVRVASTGVLAHFVDPELATGFFHTSSGLIVFLIGLAILYKVGLVLQKR